MKNSEAEALGIVLNSMLDTKGIVGFKIARNMRLINDELKEYYQFKQELFKKYGEEKDSQLMISKDSPSFTDFMRELEPLANEEVNFDFRMIKENELAESGLSARQMAAIWEMVEC